MSEWQIYIADRAGELWRQCRTHFVRGTDPTGKPTRIETREYSDLVERVPEWTKFPSPVDDHTDVGSMLRRYEELGRIANNSDPETEYKKIDDAYEERLDLAYDIADVFSDLLLRDDEKSAAA